MHQGYYLQVPRSLLVLVAASFVSSLTPHAGSHPLIDPLFLAPSRPRPITPSDHPLRHAPSAPIRIDTFAHGSVALLHLHQCDHGQRTRASTGQEETHG